MGYSILLLAILFPYGYGWREAEIDFGKIKTDGSRDSLHERFHKWNLIERGLIILFMSGVFTWALMLLLDYQWWFGVAYFTYCAAVFGYVFTSKLNTLRGLPKWYVSRDPKASKTDQYFVKQAAKHGVAPSVFAGWVYGKVLIFGWIVLVLSIGLIIWL